MKLASPDWKRQFCREKVTFPRKLKTQFILGQRKQNHSILMSNTLNLSKMRKRTEDGRNTKTSHFGGQKRVSIWKVPTEKKPCHTPYEISWMTKAHMTFFQDMLPCKIGEWP